MFPVTAHSTICGLRVTAPRRTVTALDRARPD